MAGGLQRWQRLGNLQVHSINKDGKQVLQRGGATSFQTHPVNRVCHRGEMQLKNYHQTEPFRLHRQQHNCKPNSCVPDRY